MGRNHKKRRAKQAGLPPGSLVYVGDICPYSVQVSLMTYSETSISESIVQTTEEVFPVRDGPNVSWINVDGLSDVPLIEKLGGHFKIHSLVLEDILHTNQRPKIDEHDDFIYVVLRMINFDEVNMRVNSEQVSFILTSQVVITFQENQGDVFGPVRERIRSGKGRIRKLGADYLLYALMDALVDQYFVVLEKLGDKIEEMEDRILESNNSRVAKEIHELKREMILLRKSIWPLREAVGSLERLECNFVHDSTRVFIKDLYDHTIQVIDSVESYRDILSGLLEIYLASVSNKMNEIMKVLTIISTIFIPLTFIVGVYGMNFDYMPELRWTFGYLFIWGIMLGVASVMILYFRRKGWI